MAPCVVTVVLATVALLPHGVVAGVPHKPLMRSAKEESPHVMHMQQPGEPEEPEGPGEPESMQPPDLLAVEAEDAEEAEEPDEAEEPHEAEEPEEPMVCCQHTLHTLKTPDHIQEYADNTERISELTKHIEELLQTYQQCRDDAIDRKKKSALLSKKLEPGLDTSRQLLNTFKATTQNVVRSLQHLIVKDISGKKDAKKERELQERIAKVEDDKTVKSAPLIKVMMNDINKLKKAKREYKAAAREAIKCENKITALLQRDNSRLARIRVEHEHELQTDRTDVDAAVKAQKSEQQETMQQETNDHSEHTVATMQQGGSNGESHGTVDGADNVDVHTHADEIAGSLPPTCTCAGVQNSNGVGAYCIGPDETAKKWCYVIDKSGCKDEFTSALPSIARSIKRSHDACAVIEMEGRTDEKDIKATNKADTESENANKLGSDIQAKQEEELRRKGKGSSNSS